MASVIKYDPAAPSTVVPAFEGASQSTAYDPGDLVMWHADGNIVVATANACQAIAIEHPTGTTDTKTEVELLDPVTVYVMRLATGTTVAENMLGMAGVITYTVGGHTVAVGAGEVVIVGLYDPIGTDAGRLLVRFEYGLFTGM